MNSTTSQPTGQKFPLGSGPNAIDNRTLYATLAVSTGLALLFTLLLYYAWFGRNPVPRLHFGIFVSVLPALGAIVVLKLTNVFASWRGVAIIYLALFVLVLIIQAFGRMLPV